MADLNFKMGSFSNFATTAKTNGDFNVALLSDKNCCAIAVQDNNKLYQLMPYPGDQGKPLIGQGASSSPIYADTLSTSYGGTGLTESDIELNKLYYFSSSEKKFVPSELSYIDNYSFSIGSNKVSSYWGTGILAEMIEATYLTINSNPSCYTVLYNENSSSQNWILVPEMDGQMVVTTGNTRTPINGKTNTYDITFVNNTNRDYDLFVAASQAFSYELTGSTSENFSRVILGNNNASTTLKSTGQLSLYGKNGKITTLSPRADNGNNFDFVLPKSSATAYAVWSPNASTAVGSNVQPVYIDTTGQVVVCNAYTSLLTDFSSSNNTLSLTVGGTTETASAINSVSNTWITNASTYKLSLKTTVNGVDGTAVEIPVASDKAYGVVSTEPQTFAGVKTFTSAIKLGSFGMLGFGATISQGWEFSSSDATLFPLKQEGVWLTSKGDSAGSETSGLYMDGDLIRFWSPGDSPVEFLDSDSKTSKTYLDIVIRKLITTNYGDSLPTGTSHQAGTVFFKLI